MAVAKIHILHNHSVPNNHLTTDQTTQTAERQSLPGSARALGAAERLPCMHLTHNLVIFSTCHLSTECLTAFDSNPLLVYAALHLHASHGTAFHEGVFPRTTTR